MERTRRSHHPVEKKGGVWRALTWLLFIVAVAFAGYVVYAMMTLNILNARSINTFIYGGIAFVLGLVFILLVTKKLPKLTFVLALLSVGLLGGGAYLVYSGTQAVHKLQQTTKVEVHSMSLVVRSDSPMDDVSDLQGVTVQAPILVDQENIEALTADVKEKKNIALQMENVATYATAYENLINGKAEAIVLNGSYANLLSEVDAEYSKKIKVLHEFENKKNVQQGAAKPKTSQDGSVFNVYISGIDTYGGISTVSRSDVNIIMSVNTNTKQVLLTTTPRDSYVPIADGGNNQRDKLTHAGLYGVDASIHTLENLYGINIDYYTRINFTSFLKLIDLVGGVDVYNDQAFVSHVGGMRFDIGTLHMDSAKALAFVRERYSLANGDFDRAANQQKVIAALIGKLTQPANLSKAGTILNELSTSLQTNMPFDAIMTLVNAQLESGQSYQVTNQALRTTGSMGLPSYAMPGYNLYMGVVDEISLSQVSQAMQSVLSGR